MRGRLSNLTGAVLIAALALTGIVAQPALADGGTKGSDQHRGQQYLALGDSVPFGFNPLVVPPDPAKYVGYPELAAPKLRLALTNGSCPGQSSAGFISLNAVDNGCNEAKLAGFPLHVAYTSTQLDFAVNFLKSNPHTRLVSLSLGGNDLLLCVGSTADSCASELDGILKNYEKNLRKILRTIRKVYHGEIVAVTYYALDYSDEAFTGAINKVNEVTTRVTSAFHGTTADGFAVFAAAAVGSGGDTCAAGLRIVVDPSGSCDIHPNAAGARLLADTLTAAVVRHPASDDDPHREDSLVGANG